MTRGQQQWLRALVAAARGDDLDGALEAAEDAVGLLADGPLPAEHGRSLLVLAEVHERRGEQIAAVPYRRRAQALFHRIGHVWWADRAAPATALPALTTGEQAVVDLVVGGASNRDVAAALHLSVRTVEGHLSRAYRKLGVRSRRELTAGRGAPAPTDEAAGDAGRPGGREG